MLCFQDCCVLKKIVVFFKRLLELSRVLPQWATVERKICAGDLTQKKNDAAAKRGRGSKVQKEGRWF